MNLTTPFDLKVRTALALIWSLFLQPASRRTTRSGFKSAIARISPRRERAVEADRHEAADRSIQLAGLPPPPAPSRADYPSLAAYERAKARCADGTPTFYCGASDARAIGRRAPTRKTIRDPGERFTRRILGACRMARSADRKVTQPRTRAAQRLRIGARHGRCD